MMSDFAVENGLLIKYTGTDKKVVVPEGIVGIGDDCFEDSKIESIVFPNTLKVIGPRSFINCYELTEVNIPDSVTLICSKAFMNCEKLRQIKLSNNIQSIPWKCFFGCYSLKNIVIPEGVTTIGQDAFCGCDKMRYCVLPKSLTYIGEAAFFKFGRRSSKVGIYVVYKGNPRKIEIGNAPFENNYPYFVESIDEIPGIKNGQH